MTEVRRVSDSIICLRRASYQTCSYIVQMADGLVIVDAGMSSDGSDVQTGLKALSATAADIRAILLTHWHNDHAAGAQVAHADQWCACLLSSRRPGILYGHGRRDGCSRLDQRSDS